LPGGLGHEETPRLGREQMMTARRQGFSILLCRFCAELGD
jgi:hypothetical protein